MKAAITEKEPKAKKRNYKQELWRSRYLYLLIFPGFALMLLFHYVPLYGLVLAFKDFNAGLGIFGSPWNGIDNFKNLLSDSYFWYVFFNTIRISLGRLIFQFPVPIILAILFNELRGTKLKKTLQTVYTFPHFLSWVILSGIVINILDYNGPINALLDMFGMERILFLGEKNLFIPILYIGSIWKESGWSSIIYLSSIAGINAELYEAADLDGASRFQKARYITLPSIAPTICVMLIMFIGNILGAGFDQIFNLANPVVQKTADILDTYIYRITFLTSGDFSLSTTVTLFISVFNFLALTGANKLTRKVQGTGILEGGK